MNKVWCIIRKENGEIANKKIIRRLFDQLKDGRYLVSVERADKRSLSQNRYYWLMLTEYIQPALYDFGWEDIKTKENAHDYLCEKFLRVRIVNEATGEMRERTKSTTELTKEEFDVYLEDIWRWSAQELEVAIPGPNEQTMMAYE